MTLNIFIFFKLLLNHLLKRNQKLKIYEWARMLLMNFEPAGNLNLIVSFESSQSVQKSIKF